MKRQSKRQQIIETSYEVFRESGFFATSMDELIEAANVSRRTMYNHFSSKNALVLAVIEYYADDYERNLNNFFIQKNAYSTIDKLQALFDFTSVWYKNKLFHGCVAVQAMTEYGQHDKEIVRVCHEFKNRQFLLISDLVRQAKLKKPETIARQLFVAIEGLTVIAGFSEDHLPKDTSSLFEKIISAQ